MKKAIPIIYTFIVAFLVGVAGVGSYFSHTRNYHMSTVDPLQKDRQEIVYIYVEQEPEIITEYVYVPQEENGFRNLTEEDCWYLQDMAMREAEGEGVVGQLWVMYCVICRAEAFNQSIKQVCESSAFESSRFRSGLTPNDDCNEALALIEAGWTPKPLWFARDNYHQNLGTPMCQYGHHCFSMK